MKKISMIFGLSLVATAAFAQSGEVKGRILRHDGSPATQVTVTLDNSSEVVNTDNNGVFVLDVKAGKHKLTVHAVGVKTKTIEVVVNDDKNIDLNDIYLNKGNTDLDEVVIGDTRNQYVEKSASGGLRVNTPLVELPQNVQVVTAKALEAQQATTMSDGVIRNVSGATRLEHWGDVYARIDARGGRLSPFRNGENISSNWGPLTEDMAFVDRIEFIKGPAGFMMSTGEPSGIYNVVTKRPTGETKGEASVMFGSYDFYRASVDLDGKLDKDGKLLYRLNVLGQTKNSFRPYEYNDRYGFAPVLSYKLDDKTTLTAEYIFQHVKMSNVGSFYVFSTEGYATTPRNFTMSDPNIDPTIGNDHNINFTLEHKFNSNWKLTAQASYYNYSQIGSSMWVAADSANVPAITNHTVVRSLSNWDARNVMKFGQVYVNGDIQTGPVHHRILGGLDLGNKQYMADWNSGHNLDTYTNPFDINNPSYGNPSNGYANEQYKLRRDTSLAQRAGIYGVVNQSYTAVYVQDELGFFNNKLRLTLAGRYTYVQNNDYATVTTGKQFTPRVGLSYSIDNATSVYALYDQSFIPQTGITRDSTPVKALTGNNMEIGLKRDWFDGKWTSSISAYRILKNNQTSPDPTTDPSKGYLVQFGQTKTQGVEIDVRGEIVRGLTLVANYAYTSSKISKDAPLENQASTVGNVVPGYAKHTANAWLNYRIESGALKGFGISGGFTYLADRTTWSWDATSAVKALPTYFKLDGGLFYEVGKIRVTANIFNIADKYLYSGSNYGAYYYTQAEAGRNWRMGVNYRF